MKIGIVARPEIPRTVEMAKKVMKLLGKRDILLYQPLAKKLDRKGAEPEELKRADAIISIGGDGTVLRAQRIAPNVPLLGINLGVRGFLAEVEPFEIEKAIGALLAKKLRVVKKDRLKATVGKTRLPDALNDIVISPEMLGKTIALTVYLDGKTTFETRSDGIIVSTPTGSTAYSRSAGGPILDPKIGAMILVPICPSDSTIPPLVFPIDRTIEIELTMEEREALVAVDGEESMKLGYEQMVKVTRSERPATFYAWKDFYPKLKEKLL